MINTIKNYAKTHYIISGTGALIVVIILFFAFGGSSKSNTDILVEKGTVTQKVIVTGKTKAVKSANLGFETNGKIAQTYVEIGAKVVPGQSLASLNQSGEYASLLRAQADLASSRARLDELVSGTRPEEITISEAEVANAQVSLADAQNNLATKVGESYSKADDAIHNSIDALFSNPKSTNPQINISISDNQIKNDINGTRAQLETLFANWKINSSDGSALAVQTSKTSLNTLQNFVEKVASAVNTQTTSSGLSQSTVDSYKASVSAARTSISLAISNLSAAEEKYNGAQSNLSVAQKTLLLKKSGNTPESIAAQKAVVMQNEAGVAAAESQLGKMTLRSPQYGIVTKQDAKAGEIVTPGKALITVISDSDLEIESNVSEISIGKVTIGNKVEVSLDAFPGKTFEGAVSYVDPAETIVDGVVNYKVTIAFAQKYPELKSGLTTNLEIVTATKPGVLRVPRYALTRKNDLVYAYKKIGKNTQEVPVTLGLVGEDGYVEVLTGLTDGDTIEAVPPTTAK